MPKSQQIDRSKLAVIYARYSSHNQGEQSIEGQIAEAKKFADSRGYTIINEYIDRAKTGKNDNREAFQRMLRDTSKKQFGIIIMWKVDRFGRNRTEIAINKQKCTSNGVRLEYVAETIPDTPEGVILESVLEGFAEYYSKQLSQNVQRGQRKSAEKCQSVGGNYPLGYKIGKDKKFEIDEKDAETVKLIFEMYSNGSTVPEIVAYLNGLGLRTKKGKPFAKNSLYSILRNEKYTGVYMYKEMKVPGGMPRIIDDEMFSKVQSMLKLNQRAPASRWCIADYILTDKLFCGHCGNAMVGESGTSQTGDKHTYYVCTGRRRKHICKKKSVKQEWIENVVLSYALELLYNDKLLEQIINQTWDFYNKQDENKAELEALHKSRQQVQTAIDNLVRAIEMGILNEATKRRMDELLEQQTAIEASIAEIEIAEGVRLKREHIAYFLYKMRELDYKKQDARKLLVKTFINSVFLYDDKLTITFNYTGDGNTITLSDLKAAQNGDNEFVQRLLCSTTRTTIYCGSFVLYFDNTTIY